MLIRELLARGADPNARDLKNNSVLCMCLSAIKDPKNRYVQPYTVQCMRAICSKMKPDEICSASYNVKDNNVNVLIIAIILGSYPAVKLLLDLGCNVNTRDQTNSTPLHHAAELDLVHIVDLLLQRGANVLAEDNKRNTPLALCIGVNISDSIESAILILDHIKRNNLKQPSTCQIAQYTSIVCAAAAFSHCSLLELFLDFGLPCDPGPIPSIHAATKRNMAPNVRILLERGLGNPEPTKERWIYTCAPCSFDRLYRRDANPNRSRWKRRNASSGNAKLE